MVIKENLILELAYGLGNFSIFGSKNFDNTIKHVLPKISWIETADSYFYPANEKNLSKYLIGENCKIITKVGGFKTNLPPKLNKTLVRNKAYQKYLKTRLRNIGAFDPRITPLSIKQNAEKSTNLLGKKIDIYMLHGVPENLEDYKSAMLELKSSNLVNNIGISIDVVPQVDLDWADYVLGPIELFEQVKLNNKLIIRNSFTRPINFIRDKFPDESIILTGTRNLDHFDYFFNAINS